MFTEWDTSSVFAPLLFLGIKFVDTFMENTKYSNPQYMISLRINNTITINNSDIVGREIHNWYLSNTDIWPSQLIMLNAQCYTVSSVSALIWLN